VHACFWVICGAAIGLHRKYVNELKTGFCNSHFNETEKTSAYLCFSSFFNKDKLIVQHLANI